MNEIKEKTKGLLKNPKAVNTIIFGGLALILLIFFVDVFSGLASSSESSRGGASKNADGGKRGVETVNAYEEQLEQKLRKAISAIDGVGDMTIVVSIDSLSETVYSDRGSSVQKVITPTVRGVAIVCDGGDDIIVKQKIVELVSRVLGINSTKISVCK